MRKFTTMSAVLGISCFSLLVGCQSGNQTISQATGAIAGGGNQNPLSSIAGGGTQNALGSIAGGVARNQLGNIASGAVGNQLSSGSGQLISTLANQLAGGVIGGSIGNNLDTTSRNAALGAEYNALERGTVGQPVAWQGANGNFGQVIPQQPYQVGSQNCRRYTHTIHVGGVPQQASGTACRNPDGSWKPLT